MNPAVVWTLARRLALSSDRAQRWRQVSVILGAHLAVLALLLTAGVLTLGHRLEQVADDRAPVHALTSRDTAGSIAAYAMLLPGFGQFPVVWLDPVKGHESDPAVVPPGLDRLPPPGAAVLSPGLEAAGFTAEDFGFTSARTGSGAGGAIGDEGLASRSEGLIYARPTKAVIDSQERPWRPIAGYGVPGSGDRIEAYNDVPTWAEAWMGSLWLLLGPALYLLLSSATAMSTVREDRAQTLWRQGATTAIVRWVVAVETMVLALIGALPAWALWQLWLSRQESVPFGAAELTNNAMVLPWWATLAVTLGAVILAAMAAAAGRVLGRPVAQQSRRLQSWQLLPLLVGFGLMFAAPFFPGDRRMLLLFAGLVVTLAALPLGLPVLVSALGPALVPSRTVAGWLASQRLAHRTTLLTRPAVMVAAVTIITGAAFAIIGGAMSATSQSGSVALSEHRLWKVRWSASTAPFPQASTGSAVLPTFRYRSEADEERHGGPASAWIAAPDCAAFAELVLDDGVCAGPDELSAAGKALAQHLGGEVVFGDPSSHGAQRGALVRTPPDTSEAAVYRLFAGHDALYALNVAGPEDSNSAGVGWIQLGFWIATVLLFAAVLREVGDRVLMATSDDGLLARVGLSPADVERVHGWSLAAPVLIAVPVGTCGAILFGLRGIATGVTAVNVGMIVMMAVFSVLASAAVIGVTLVLRRRAEEA